MKHEGNSYQFQNEVEYFNSFSEALEVAKTRKKRGSMWGSWAGGIKDWGHADKMNKEGYAEGAAKLTSSFDAAALASIATQGDSMALDYQGFVPCIPSYLAGEPLHMRRKVPCETSKAPITIVVGAGSSGGIDVKTMEERAAAIACLVLYLSAYRAVNLYITCFLQSTSGNVTKGTGYYFPMVKLGTTPIDLPQLAWQLVHPFNARGILYTLGNYGESGITWAEFKGKSSYKMDAKELRAVAAPILDLQPDDILIPDVKLRDKDMADPEAWAKTRLREMGYDI